MLLILKNFPSSLQNVFLIIYYLLFKILVIKNRNFLSEYFKPLK